MKQPYVSQRVREEQAGAVIDFLRASDHPRTITDIACELNLTTRDVCHACYLLHHVHAVSLTIEDGDQKTVTWSWFPWTGSYEQALRDHEALNAKIASYRLPKLRAELVLRDNQLKAIRAEIAQLERPR
jgi:hypothetical protein